jgi:hypothetical protein
VDGWLDASRVCVGKKWVSLSGGPQDPRSQTLAKEPGFLLLNPTHKGYTTNFYELSLILSISSFQSPAGQCHRKRSQFLE